MGCPKKYQNEMMKASSIYVWDDLGMGCYYNEVSDEYDDLFLTVEDNEYKYTNTVFQGELLVDKKSYLDCSWKETMSNYYETKYGCFELVRFMGKQLPMKVDIYYRKPRSNKYKLKKIKEQEIVFDNFNFKLAVMGLTKKQNFYNLFLVYYELIYYNKHIECKSVECLYKQRKNQLLGRILYRKATSAQPVS